MRDVLFPLVLIVFFALASLLVRGCERLIAETGEHRAAARRRSIVSAGDIIGLALAVAALVYLVWALLYPERL